MAGEAPPPPAEAGAASPLLKAFDCPSCGAAVTVRAAGHSLVATCGACLSVIDVTNENYRVLSTYAKNLRVRPLIELGKRGRLRGELFEVIGFLQKRDASGQYHWEEYLLFNPYQGYRWLVLNQGHWTLFKMTKQLPTAPPYERGRLDHLGRRYRVFDRGTATVSFVLGEFYWRVCVGDLTRTQDWISPPYMLSAEKDESEEIWSLGEYLEPQEVEGAFPLSGARPERVGVGPNQPIGADSSGPIQAFSALFVALLVTHLAASHGAREAYEGSFELQTGGPPKTAAPDPGASPAPALNMANTEPFVLEGDSRSVTVALDGDVYNRWLDVHAALLEQPPGDRAFRFDQELSYYEGQDSDGHWTEGSQRQNETLSSIPGGTYYLSLEGESEAGRQPVRTKLGVRVLRGGLLWSNFWLGLLAIGVFPLIELVRDLRFEGRRWEGSDLGGADE